MNSDLLFYKDSFLFEFDATVLVCTASEKGYKIILNQTAFYPEGGGQPADIGWLNDTKVLDVQYKEDTIIHYTDTPITAGTFVKGKINSVHRIDLMQQHTGEHILSGILHKLYKVQNVGFHIGKEVMTADFSIFLSDEQLQKAEILANQAIQENIKVESCFYTHKELENKYYRSKKELEGPIRLVTIKDYDTCACCGVHMNTTGQIGMLKIIRSERYKSGIRLTILCGKRAYNHYQTLLEAVSDSSKLLSAKSENLVESISKLQQELLEQKTAMIARTRQYLLLKAHTCKIGEPFCLLEPDLSSNELRFYATSVAEYVQMPGIVFTTQGETFRYTISSPKQDIRPFMKQLNQRFHGKGGGKETFCQGSLQGDYDAIQDFVQAWTFE